VPTSSLQPLVGLVPDILHNHVEPPTASDRTALNGSLNRAVRHPAPMAAAIVVDARPRLEVTLEVSAKISVRKAWPSSRSTNKRIQTTQSTIISRRMEKSPAMPDDSPRELYGARRLQRPL
jgi:hypothetical protein